MVVSDRTFIEHGAENLHLDPQKAAERLDERFRELTGIRLTRTLNPISLALSNLSKLNARAKPG